MQYRAHAVLGVPPPARDFAFGGSAMANYQRLVYIQSLAFFLIFGAFNSSQSLAGSLPAPPGLAPFQFMALYGAFTLACIPAPKLVSLLGPKRSMLLGGLPYLGLIVSFLSPPLCEGGKTDGCWPSSTICAPPPLSNGPAPRASSRRPLPLPAVRSQGRSRSRWVCSWAAAPA